MSTPDNPLIDAARGRDAIQHSESLQAQQFLIARRGHLGSRKSMCDDNGKDAWDKYTAAADLIARQAGRIAELEAQQERKPLTVAALDTRQVVSDDELAKAFAGTNFGSADLRQELHVAVLKKASGYHCGHTITTIMRELRLIGVHGLPTKKGRRLISLAFHALMVGGP